MTRLRHNVGRGRFDLYDDEGSSIVEFAVGASLLFMLAIGIISLSLALYTYNVVAESAREGARFAIVRGSACHFASACPASQADIQTYIKNIGFPAVNSGNLTATAAWSAYPAGGNCTPSAACNNPSNQVKVTVTYQFPLVIPFVPSRNLSMSSTAAMVISQ